MLWQKRDFKGLILLLERYHDTHTRLIFHSALFQVIFLIFTLYIFTSSGSLFGSGLVAGINLHLLKDEWQDYSENPAHLNDWLFWRIKRKVSFGEQKIFLILMLLGFLGLNSFLI
jgi:hypothetical protein